MKSIVRLRNTFAHSLGEIREEDYNTLEKLASVNKGLQVLDGYIYADMDFTNSAIERTQTIISACVAKIGHPEMERILNRVKSSCSNRN